MTDTVTLSIPRNPQYYSVVRMVVGGIAAGLQLSYDALDDLQLAIGDYTKAIEANARYTLAYKNRGDARLEKRDFDGAILDYLRAIDINPDYAEAYFGHRGLRRGCRGGSASAVIRSSAWTPPFLRRRRP